MQMKVIVDTERITKKMVVSGKALLVTQTDTNSALPPADGG
jgi:hypothetical protein